MHVLPKGFHRIRHYGLLASGNRAANIARARELLAVPSRSKQPETSETAAADEPRVLPRPCPLLRRPHDHHRDLRSAAASRNTALRPLQRRSGSTPHDAVTTDPPAQRHSPFSLALGRHSPRLLRSINRPAIAPPTLSSNARSARSARHPHPSCEAKPIGAGALDPTSPT